MFDNTGYMVGMHGFRWMFWLVLIGAFMLLGWGNAGVRGIRTREDPHEVLRRRLANDELTPAQYEERTALLDRDSHQPSRSDASGEDARTSFRVD